MLKNPKKSFSLKLPPKSWLRFGFKFGVAAAALELLALGASYYGWRKLNTDQGTKIFFNTHGYKLN